MHCCDSEILAIITIRLMLVSDNGGLSSIRHSHLSSSTFHDNHSQSMTHSQYLNVHTAAECTVETLFFQCFPFDANYNPIQATDIERTKL